MQTVLLLGSGPNVTAARGFERSRFDHVLAINNAWQVRDDWDALIHPWDFPAKRRPSPKAGQRLVTEADFVPAQNALGGFVYAGGTMAFTAAYWVLHACRPAVVAVLGCDMHYPSGRHTHFYGTGQPDPLRADITLQSLEAKSARLMILAAMQDCAMVNLSQGRSRLIFPRGAIADARKVRPPVFCPALAAEARALEAALGYYVPTGRYWLEEARFDRAALAELDALWLAAARMPWQQSA